MPIFSSSGNTNNFTNVQTGDYVLRDKNGYYPGYLRCNGASVSKTTYSNLYSVISDNYSIVKPLTVGGVGNPHKQQYEFNQSQSSDIVDWQSAGNLPVACLRGNTIVTKNRVYLFGIQVSGPTNNNTIYTATIDQNGIIGSWSTSGTMPDNISIFSSLVIGGKLYIFGGYNSNYRTVSTIYSCSINSDGTLGTWSSSGNLPSTAGFSCAFCTNNYVYVTGIIQNTSGTDTATNLVFYAPINSDQSLGPWGSGYTLPASGGVSVAAITKNRVYIIGGINSGNTGPVSTVYTAVINADGTLGSWSAGPSLVTAVFGPQCVVTKNKVYIIGGNFAGVPNVQCSYINPDGTLVGWYNTNSLPIGLGYSHSVVTSSKIYLLGGNNSSGGAISNIYYGSFTGGLNDYSAYQGYTTIDPNYFNIPDLSPYETRRDVGFFIKT